MIMPLPGAQDTLSQNSWVDKSISLGLALLYIFLKLLLIRKFLRLFQCIFFEWHFASPSMLYWNLTLIMGLEEMRRIDINL